MRLRQLEYVIAVAEEESFTEAARTVRVSQPALSHQVKALEAELGGALFERPPGRVRPTARGARFLPHARAAVAAARAAEEAARAAARLEAGELRVAALHSTAMGIVPPAIGAWRRAHPAVHVELTEFSHIDLLAEAMARGEADIAVGSQPEGRPGPCRVLGEQELLVVLPMGDPLLARYREGGIPLELLADRPWVLYSADFGLTPLVVGACQRHPHLLLQGADLVGQRRLADPEPLGGSGERALLHHGEEVFQRLRTMAPPILQCALAAALAWVVAAQVLGHAAPFFAPVAAVLCIGVGAGRRWRRVLELVAGVGVGVGVGDLLISAIGSGPWQIALVLVLAMSVSVLLDNGALTALQAGSSAVLVATLLPPGGTAGLDRMTDALLGGLIGPAAVALLPADPAALAARHVRGLLDELGAALGTAHETAALSPLHHRADLAPYFTAAEPLDHALRNVRVMLRHTVAVLEKGEDAPGLLAEGMEDLARSVARLGEELPQGGALPLTRRALLRTAARRSPSPAPAEPVRPRPPPPHPEGAADAFQAAGGRSARTARRARWEPEEPRAIWSALARFR